MNWAYGIEGPAQGHYFVNPENGDLEKSINAYEHPQPHACFIQSVSDDLVNQGGIMDLWTREARLFKFGSGTGSNFSHVRGDGENLSGGGKSSGLMSFLRIGDRSAGAIKSGGTTRRAAKMVVIDVDHPDIEEFIHCKDDDDTLQNFNISVQITDEFMKAVDNDEDFALVTPRDTGDGPVNEVVATVRAKDLWDDIAESAWKTGDPGVVFVDRVWETAPNPQMGKIKTSNPCGEEFLENYSNCCLGSINLDLHINGTDFDWDLLEDTTRLAVRFLNDVIEVNSFPLAKLREVNLDTRRIGLGVMGLSLIHI